CRDMPKVNIDTLQIKGFISEINDTDLNFTESELAEYLRHEGLSCASQTVREIYEDTGGWAFAVNLVCRSLKRAPDYTGFVKTTLRQNIFKLMEEESWNAAAPRIKHFLIRLSLVNIHSAELVNILADGDNTLLSELREQGAYLRYDNYGGVYLINRLFLDFLRTKQDILTDDERRGACKTAADWYRRNNLKMDALSCYEKTGDYESIVSIFWELLGVNTSQDFAIYAAGIFHRAPSEVFHRVTFFAAMHLCTLLCLTRWQEFFTLAESYEEKFLSLPKDDAFRNHNLGIIYFFKGFGRFLMSTADERYDFDEYYAKAADSLTKPPADLLKTDAASFGAWVSSVGSAKKDAPQKFLEAVIRTEKNAGGRIGGANGASDLCHGELKFYQGKIDAAEFLFVLALEQGRRNKQFEIIHRALFYIMRIAIAKGDREKVEQTLRDTALLLEMENYSRRFITYDITKGFYACAINRSEMTPDWLKGKFTPYGHSYFIENFGNQIKARYCYLTKDYYPLLSYIKELKQRESVLYGRVEMLAMEACVLYKMKNNEAAFAALQTACETAYPNDIKWPFIELGKEMNTLLSHVLKSKKECNVPYEWLKSVSRKSSSYAKQQALLISNCKSKDAEITALSLKESEILHSLHSGLSRTEAAAALGLSLNTINSAVVRIYGKLSANNIADAVRIALENKLI
ncbi:MAG: LuxR C-terminal-related transcriptional regulator, partial [Chitinispirillia bacterium]|nr:LuxR C-terminal-related transcriptional regulator [Chitinispirillia bacterium]